jgi:glycosyltransferase involved in cell wall biosynthesis
MKVLIINPSCWIYGGAERVIVQLCNWLTDRHHNVSLITSELCPEFRKALKETRIIKSEGIDDLVNFVQKIVYDFDVIHIHNEPGYLTIFPKKRNVVWSCNEPPHLDNPIPSETEKNCVSNFKVIVADKFNQERFKDLYEMNSHIIPYPIDYDFFRDNPNKIEKNQEMTFIQVGWIADTKNQLRTIEIFKSIKMIYPEAKLILVGKKIKDYFQLVREKVMEYKLMSDIEIVDFSDREKIRDLYHQSHIGLFPIKSQGGWLSIFEAMSAGLPVMVSEEATCSSILKENNLGFVCKTDDDFVSAVKKINLVKNEDHLFVKDNLTLDNYCSEVVKLYENTK